MSKRIIDLVEDEATGEKRVAPAMLERMLELGAQGKTRAGFAKAFGVAKTTVDLWRKTYPEFGEAYDIATAASQAWWEEFGQQHLITERGATFNQTVWHRFMASHFRDDWMERHEVTTRDGDRADIGKLTDEELDAEIEKAEAAKAALAAARENAAKARERSKAQRKKPDA